MPDHSRIVERIRKLLALSQNNPSEEEAVAALLLAQETMVKYNLNELDIIKFTDSDSFVEQVAGLSGLKRIAGWQSTLARVIANNFRCDFYHAYGQETTRSGARRRSYEQEIMFVGLPTDVRICVEVYKRALDYADMYCTWYLLLYKVEHGRTLTKSESKQLRGSWHLGFVQGIHEKFKAQVKKHGWELVLVTPGLVVQHMKDLKLRSLGGSSARVWDKTAHEDGREKGRNFGSENQEKQKSSADRGPRLLGE